MWDTIKNWCRDFRNFLSNRFDKTDNFLGTITQFFKDIPKNIDKLFNPKSEYLEEEFSVEELLKNKLMFIEQFKTAINNVSKADALLQLPKANILGCEININGKFFEPYVPKIRSGIATLFHILTALAIFKMISNVFHHNVNVDRGGIYSDSSHLQISTSCDNRIFVEGREVK